MSARAPRRTFAAPLVITVAAACGGPIYTNPPPASYDPPAQGPTTPPPRDPPPGPQPQPTHPENPPPPTEPQPQPTSNPPMPQPPGTVVTPPPATTDTMWTIYKADGTCHAYHDTSCPPRATCNPPPPVDYQCPAGFTDESRVKVVRPENATTCYIVGEPKACPPNARCKPADRTPAPCPSR